MRETDPGKLAEKTLRGERLNREEAARLYEEAPFLDLGRLADAARQRRHPDGVATYVVDRNINYTNICSSRCRFCAFYRDPEAPDAYVLDRESLYAKVAETVALGGSGILLQGGLHPGLDLPWFESLLRDLRDRFRVDLHCFSPPEILHMAALSGVSTAECLRRLVAAGLTSLPGGGAEILSDPHRRKVSPSKCTTDEWLSVMETAHGLGLKTTATMMFGSGETFADRLAHLDRLRSLQDRTGGFVSFIPWTFQWPNTDLGNREGPFETGGMEYMRMVALSRLYLDNFRTVQASWVTMGLKIAQVALRFGADDLGSVMIEENVVAAAGAVNHATEAELRRLIADAGFTPARRNSVHQRLED